MRKLGRGMGKGSEKKKIKIVKKMHDDKLPVFPKWIILVHACWLSWRRAHIYILYIVGSPYQKFFTLMEFCLKRARNTPSQG